jgi:type VI secretion system ImpM family protein
MLGIGKLKTNVEFSAHGKHPAFNDYFSLNIDSPLASALSSWVEKGAKLEGNHNKNKIVRSFRFWVRGIKKDELVLGIIRDSSDRLGRYYPLLIMGKGFVKDWDKSWNYIFSGYETVFRAFEDMTALRYDSFKEFETRLTRINFFETSSTNDDTRFQLSETMLAWFRKNREKGVLALPIATLLGNADSYPKGLEEQGFFKKKIEVPGAVFLGGLSENPVLSIYTRPLNADDFSRLFNGSNGN